MGRVALAALLAAGALLPAACNKGDAKVNAPPGGRGGMAMAVPVLVGQAQSQSVPIELNSIGTVEPSSSVDIKSLIAGQLLKIDFREGQEVKAGDLLFEIDPRPYQAALAQAEAGLDQSRAQLDKARADLARDLVQMRNADTEASRTLALLKRKIASPDDYDKDRTAAETLAASAQSDRASVGVAEQAVKVSQAMVATAQINLSYCTIRSPIDGRVGQLQLHQGDIIKANDVPLVTLDQMKPIYVSFSMDEQNLPELRRQMGVRTLSVQAQAEGDNDSPPVGQLTFVDNAVDRSTGRIALRATFPNDDGRLWPGQFVQTRLKLNDIDNAVVVPAQAVQPGQTGDYVFVVKGDKTVMLQPVKTGLTLGDKVVVEEGLQAGDEVVTDGQLRLAPGAHVEVKSTVAVAGEDAAGSSTAPKEAPDAPPAGRGRGAAQGRLP